MTREIQSAKSHLDEPRRKNQRNQRDGAWWVLFQVMISHTYIQHTQLGLPAN